LLSSVPILFFPYASGILTGGFLIAAADSNSSFFILPQHI
jgi:hypothetical protein